MPTCRICQHTFKSLKFQTEHIGICNRCVNTLNDNPEPARNAEARFAEKLARGMQRNADRDLQSDEEWKRKKARVILADLDTAVADALHDWITRLLEKSENSTRDFKIMRAHRRGLLREEGFVDYPEGWTDVAYRIRRRDGCKCTSCFASDTTMDVHHIIYLSNHGTNQQSNLITLCRTCHEAEHKRAFDWPEAKDPEQVTPIRAPKNSPAPPPAFAPSTQHQAVSTTGPGPSLLVKILTPPEPRTELRCPTCSAELTIPTTMAQPRKVIRCPKCAVTFDFIGTFPISRARHVDAPVVSAPIQRQVQLAPVPSVASNEPKKNPVETLAHKPVNMWTTDLLAISVAALGVALLVLFATFWQ